MLPLFVVWYCSTALFAFRQLVRLCTLHYLSVHHDRRASVFHVFGAVNVNTICRMCLFTLVLLYDIYTLLFVKNLYFCNRALFATL